MNLISFLLNYTSVHSQHSQTQIIKSYMAYKLICHQSHKINRNGDCDMMTKWKTKWKVSKEKTTMGKPSLMKQIHCDKRSFIVKEKPFPTLYWLIDNLLRKIFIAPKAFELFIHMSCFYGWCICDHDWNLWLNLTSFWRFTS